MFKNTIEVENKNIDKNDADLLLQCVKRAFSYHVLIFLERDDKIMK